MKFQKLKGDFFSDSPSCTDVFRVDSVILIFYRITSSHFKIEAKNTQLYYSMFYYSFRDLLVTITRMQLQENLIFRTALPNPNIIISAAHRCHTDSLDSYAVGVSRIFFQLYSRYYSNYKRPI